MRVLRLLTVAGIVLALAAASAQAQEQEKEKGKGKGKGRPGVMGVVKSVTINSDNTGTIVLTVREGGRGKAKDGEKGKAKTEDKTFKVTSSTKFFTRAGRRGKAEPATDATFKDVKKGERIAIVLAEGKADEAARVAIITGRPGGKAKKEDKKG